MQLREVPLTTIDGDPTSLAAYADRAVLIVNVASKCGMTPQYAKLEELQRTYGERGFTVLGVPCNQFLGQEPGSADDIKTFCAMNYGVTFPLLEKAKVNGRHSHPLYRILRETKDAAGKRGRVQWNFEKFLVSPDGSIARFRPSTEPDDPAVVAAIEAALPAA
ncbi:glutathione peroxidase [Leucobacter luti]|uniref:Glutathione peroxidase n=1 Tax=Leucobacter luti TaxID=340320 RepID=A0A4R6RRQ7_9MICO|nr:glutathione peroxidase [Leucobacter luti]QYM76125.1 glutathione peroxidase [Leucobacter luti]TDP89460.1 glutathione peroxidase [Leucobacter luti]